MILRKKILFLGAAFLLGAALRADTVYLKNGKEMHGEVVRDDDRVVVLKVPFGQVTLRRAEVEFVERATPLENKLDLGRQLLQQGHLEKASDVFLDVYLGNKENAEARRMLATALLAQARHYRELNRLREARDVLENLLKVDPHAELVQHDAERDLKEISTQEERIKAVAEKARDLEAHDQLDTAIRCYEAALSLSPDQQAEISPLLAECHVRRAKVFAESGRGMNAAGEIEAALKYDPRLADKLETFYVACALPHVLSNMQTGNLPDAATDLKRMLRLMPDNKSILYAAGRLEEALGHLPGAADFYTRALGTRAASATPEFIASVRQKVEKLVGIEGSQWKIETGYVQLDSYTKSSEGAAKILESENFSVHHYNDQLAREVVEKAEAQRSRIITMLNLKPNWSGKAKIFIHRTQAEYTATTAQPEWTGGCSRFTAAGGQLSDPQIHTWQTSPRLLKSVLPHELTHLLVNGCLTDVSVLPRSLNEGLAVLMEPEYRKEYFQEFLKRRMKSQDFIPLQELLDSQSYPRDPEFFYAEGFSIVAYLVHKRGMNGAIELIQGLGEHKQALAELLRLTEAGSVEALEAEWKAWMLL